MELELHVNCMDPRQYVAIESRINFLGFKERSDSY